MRRIQRGNDAAFVINLVDHDEQPIYLNDTLHIDNVILKFYTDSTDVEDWITLDRSLDATVFGEKNRIVVQDTMFSQLADGVLLLDMSIDFIEMDGSIWNFRKTVTTDYYIKN